MRRRKYTVADFPPPGTILSFKLADGRFGACRILRLGDPLGGDSIYALIVLTEYILDCPPALNHPAVRKILRLTHHNWSNRPQILWIGEPPPPTFRPIGILPIQKRDAVLQSNSFSSWASFPLQRLRQWRWDHDRDALLAEDVVTAAKEEKKRAAATARRAKILATTTLPSIVQRETLFPRWTNYPSRKIKALIEQAIRSFIAAVIQINKPTRSNISRELRLCAKTLNKLDDEHGHPIETVERDDIFELFEEILIAAKHPDLLEKLDKWREW